MMCNIHNVRVDWDPMPMAIKLGQIREMLQKEGRDASIKELAGITGLRPASVRRSLELLELPKRYQRMLLDEAQKPRSQQKVKVDLFIEIFKSFNAVKRHVPEVLSKVSKEEYVDTMVDKYKRNVVDN